MGVLEVVSVVHVWKICAGLTLKLGIGWMGRIAFQDESLSIPFPLILEPLRGLMFMQKGLQWD
jgi:hypothetical protein